MQLILRTALAALAALATTLSSSTSANAPVAPPADISSLAWLAGTWVGTDGETEMEEVWLPPKGGSMLGLHRDVVGDKMVSFEFLRISTRKDVLGYIASPNGRPPTVFPLKESGDKRVVFENLQHDYPQRIIYWIDKDQALHARIEGPKDGKQPPMEWTWRRPAPAAESRPK